MTAITPVEIGDDQVLATRVLAFALSFAPGLNLLTDPDRATAVLILSGVVTEAKSRGSRYIRGERTLSSGIDYVTASWFSDEDRSALVTLAATVSVVTLPGAPAANFPSGYPVSRIWPEEYPGSTDYHYQPRWPRW